MSLQGVICINWIGQTFLAVVFAVLYGLGILTTFVSYILPYLFVALGWGPMFWLVWQDVQEAHAIALVEREGGTF